MKEIDYNKQAWNLLAEDHYHHFKKRLTERNSIINENIMGELGEIKDLTMIHLQCNTGADTISLARSGLKKIVGVDLSDQNILFANRLKKDFQLDNVDFIESNVLTLNQIHQDTYDIVFTSEGVLGWLPDLKQWARVVKSLLKEDGFFYVYDSHPFFHMFDEEALAKNQVLIRYDYFDGKADMDFPIGGYASESKSHENYWWNHKMSDIINALIEAGLKIEYVHEFDTLFWNAGNMKEIKPGLFQHPKFHGKIPMSYSIKASHQ